MSLSKFFRQVVSADSKRFQDGEFDLNLSYITPKIVAMGYPASGVEGMFRNSIVDVSQFLLEKHGGNFMIWNLSERSYDYSLFHDQVLDFGFPDHHNPPLLLLFTIINSMHAWLTADPLNIAVIHCLAGKGRTGTIIACYLLYAGIVKDPDEALEFYASQRSHISKGVTRPSQKRYIHYFYDVCFNGKSYKNIPKILKRIEFGPSEWIELAGIQPMLIVDEMSSDCYLPKEGEESPARVLVTRKYHSEQESKKHGIEDSQIYFEVDVPVAGDTTIRCNYYTTFWKRDVEFFRTSFHTAFIPENNLIRQSKKEIGLADKDDRFPPNFTITLFFEDLEPDTELISRQTNVKWTNETCSRFFEVAQKNRKQAEENDSFLKFASQNDTKEEDDFVMV